MGQQFIEYEINGDRNKTLSIKEYHDEVKPYLKVIINNIKKFDTLKIQLTIAINFISFKDIDKECVMHSKNDNTENMIYNTVDEVIEELFESPLSRCTIGLEILIKSSNFIFHCACLLY